MARTPLARLLREAFCHVDIHAEEKLSVDSPLLERSQKRRPLQKQTLPNQNTILSPLFSSFGANAMAPRIVIVGAGLAGLTCAYRLQQAGYLATLYEASNRVGGRCWTRRGDFKDEQIVERGGQLIDSGRTAIRQLARELNLTLDRLISAEKEGTTPAYYLDGTAYTYRQAARDFQKIRNKLRNDINEADYPTLYNRSTKRGRELDHMSVIDWINETVPGGIRSKFGQLLDIACNTENGAESSEQSALNLLYMLGFSKEGPRSSEEFQIRGGNDQIPTRLAEILGDRIIYQTALIAIKENGNGSYTLTFKRGFHKFDVIADKVVLTLPFSIMNRSVDFSEAGFQALKRIAIQELGMGTNTKLHVQFTDRHWDDLRCNGETFADTGYQCTFEVTRAQPGTSGILVDYTGGAIGASFNRGTPRSRAREFLDQIEPVLPGIKKKWNGRATLDYWLGNKFSRGSYSYWKVGQCTKFAGIEGKREGTKGNCHFAGEHTSIDFQGYLNGAVESGERAAREILTDLIRKGRGNK